MSQDDNQQPSDKLSSLEQELNSIRERLQAREAEVATKNQEIARLQRAQKAAEVGEPPVGVTEFEDTLRRLVQRVAMILQAEKCAIMIVDRDSGELIGRPPAYGIGEGDLQYLRSKVDEGVSGEVFRTEKPIIVHDAASDERTVNENVAYLHIRNGVYVPLIVERRDEENRVLERVSIGVLCVFNKRYGGEFIDEDVRLLERLARNAAAVIANAQMFRELIEEREKLVHTIESLYAGLLLIGGNGRLMQMNARARQIFNVQDDPAGKPYKDVLHHEKAVELLERMLSAPEQVVVEEEETKAAEEITVIEPETEEERIFQVHAAPVRGEDDRLLGNAIILNDITELRNLDRMKTEFVAIAAHELRTPMTPIKGFISMLAQDDDDTFSFEERREYYQIIDTNVDRLGRLINDLLNVTRIERGVGTQLFWEEVDLCTLSESVFEIQRGMTDSNNKHPLVIDADPKPCLATVGKDQIEQILQNLVSNAIKYSPEGGEVRIILREEPETETVLVGVQDQGTGIPESAKTKLFKPYRRIHNPKTASVKGTGVGLYLVKHLVEAHHGTIWVDSELNKGSTFWFRIPKVPTDTSEVEPKR
jgi:two-component system phosphate regulon sensor histidine kinase PhoR